MAKIIISFDPDMFPNPPSTADVILSILRTGPNVGKVIFPGDVVSYTLRNVCESSSDKES